LRRGPSLQPIALVASLEVVVLHELVEISLDLIDVLVPGGSSGDAEALVEQGSVHPLDKAVGAGRADLGLAMLDAFHRGKQFEGVFFRDAAELPPVVGEDGPDGDAQLFVEGQHAVVEQIAGGDRHLRVVDLGKRQRAEDVNNDLDVDLADALQGSPVEGVLAEQLARPGGFDVPASKFDRVALQQLDLLLAEHEGGIAGGLLQPQQAFGLGFQVVPHPDAADAAGTDGGSHQSKLIGDALWSVSRFSQRVVEDLLFDLGGKAIGMRVFRSALVLDERSDASDLEGSSDFVERVPMVAHDLAGFGDVSELLGEFEQRQFPSGTLGRGGHSDSSWVIGGWRFQFTKEDRVAAASFNGEENGDTVGK